MRVRLYQVGVRIGEARYYQTAVAVDAPQTFWWSDLGDFSSLNSDVAGHEALGVGGAAQFNREEALGDPHVAERVSAPQQLGEAQPQAEHGIFLG